MIADCGRWGLKAMRIIRSILLSRSAPILRSSRKRSSDIESPANMSSDLRKALRSRDLCVPKFAERHPELARTFHRGRSRVLRFMLGRSFRLRNWKDFRFVLLEMVRHDPIGALISIAQLALRLVGRLRRSIDGRREYFVIGRIDH